MKNFLFIIVTLLVFRPVVPLLDYLVNYDYISTVLCVNKDTPELHCNGQCYLMQQLAKTAKEEQGKDAIKKVCDIAFSSIYINEKISIDFDLVVFPQVNNLLDTYIDSIGALFIFRDLKPPLF